MVKQLTFALLLFVAVIACADDYILATGRDGTRIVYTADRMVYTNWLSNCTFWQPFPSDVGSGSYPDYSKLANNGAQTNVAMRPVWTSGAYNFDGTNDFIVSNAGSGFSGNVVVSMLSWFKAGSLSDYQTIVAMGNSSALEAMTITVTADGRAGMSCAGVNNGFIASNSVTTGTWYHIAVTKTAGAINTTTKIYLNGVDTALVSPSAGTPSVTVSPVKIGYLFVFFDGLIDDVRIYDIVLTSNQVNQIYLDTKGAH